MIIVWRPDLHKYGWTLFDGDGPLYYRKTVQELVDLLPRQCELEISNHGYTPNVANAQAPDGEGESEVGK